MYIFKKSKRSTVVAICTMLLVVCMSLFTSIPVKASGRSVSLPVSTIEESDGPMAGYTLRANLSATFSTDAEVTFAAGGEANIDYCNPMQGPPTLDAGYTKLVEYNITIKTSGYAGDTLSGTITVPLPSNCDGASAKIKDTGVSARSATASSVTFPVTFDMTSNTGYAYFSVEYKSGNGGSTGGSNESSSGASDHTHNYEWRTITEPTAERDGLKAYVCTICGAYSESVPISAYSYVCTDAANKVLTAKQNDTVVLEMGVWHSYPKWFMEELASRSDLTIKLKFEYQHEQYEVTIPAGTEIETECDWYGPLKLCSLYEHTIK